MKLSEIPPKSEIVLTVKDSNTTLNFKTRVQEPISGGGIWVDLITDSHGRSVNFSGVPVSVSYVQANRRPIVWHSAVVKLFRIGKVTRQAINSSVEGVEMNRRRVYRQKVNLPGTVNFGKDSEEVMVRDVGSTGFSFICTNPANRHGTSIVVHLTYTDLDTRISLEGRVVRVQDLPGNRVCYGCKYTGRTDIIVKYISRKKKQNAANQPKAPKQNESSTDS